MNDSEKILLADGRPENLTTLEVEIHRLRQQLEMRTMELAAVSELSGLLQTCGSMAEAGAAVGGLACRVFPHMPGVLYAMKPSDNRLAPLTHWGENESKQYQHLHCPCTRPGHRGHRAAPAAGGHLPALWL